MLVEYRQLFKNKRQYSDIFVIIKSSAILAEALGRTSLTQFQCQLREVLGKSWDAFIKTSPPPSPPFSAEKPSTARNFQNPQSNQECLQQLKHKLSRSQNLPEF